MNRNSVIRHKVGTLDSYDNSKFKKTHKPDRRLGIAVGLVVVIATLLLLWTQRRHVQPTLQGMVDKGRKLTQHSHHHHRHMSTQRARSMRRFGPTEGNHERISSQFERASFDPVAAAHEQHADPSDFGYDRHDAHWAMDEDGEYDHHYGGHNTTKRMIHFFPMIDLDHNNFISYHELEAWHHTNNEKMLLNRATMTVRDQDYNGDGLLDFDEWFEGGHYDEDYPDEFDHHAWDRDTGDHTTGEHHDMHGDHGTHDDHDAHHGGHYNDHHDVHGHHIGSPPHHDASQVAHEPECAGSTHWDKGMLCCVTEHGDCADPYAIYNPHASPPPTHEHMTHDEAYAHDKSYHDWHHFDYEHHGLHDDDHYMHGHGHEHDAHGHKHDVHGHEHDAHGHEYDAHYHEHNAHGHEYEHGHHDPDHKYADHHDADHHVGDAWSSHEAAHHGHGEKDWTNYHNHDHDPDFHPRRVAEIERQEHEANERYAASRQADQHGGQHTPEPTYTHLTPALHRELELAKFTAADYDGDGKLNVPELLHLMNPTMVERLPLRLAILNSTVASHLFYTPQLISLSQFQNKLWASIVLIDNYSNRIFSAQTEYSSKLDHGHQLFEAMDADKDGYVTLDNLLDLFEMFHPSENYHSHQSAMDQLTAADSNGDYKLSLPEMIQHIEVFYTAVHVNDGYDDTSDEV